MIVKGLLVKVFRSSSTHSVGAARRGARAVQVQRRVVVRGVARAVRAVRLVAPRRARRRVAAARRRRGGREARAGAAHNTTNRTPRGTSCLCSARGRQWATRQTAGRLSVCTTHSVTRFPVNTQDTTLNPKKSVQGEQTRSGIYRTFRVVVDGALPDARPVLARGARQLRVPARSSRYTADIPTAADATRALYADGAAHITLNAKYAAIKMQRAIDLLPEWLSKWRLSVNAGTRRRWAPDPRLSHHP